jgi:hypothetical protein
MEQRWNTRQVMQHNIILVSGGIGLVNGRTRDISYGGLYIQTAPGIQMDEQEAVRLVIPSLNPAHSIPALVVRTDHAGSGVMFTEYSKLTRMLLERILGEYAVDNAAEPAWVTG